MIAIFCDDCCRPSANLLPARRGPSWWRHLCTECSQKKADR